MTHPLTPREKVAEIIKEKVAGPHFTDPSFSVAMEQDRLAAADAILTALASGSGDHAELIGVLRADRLPECSFDDGKTWELDGVGVAETFSRAADALEALLAENAALREQVKFEKQVAYDENERWREAERKLAEAVGLLRESLAPGSFEGETEINTRIRTFLSKEAERG